MTTINNIKEDIKNLRGANVEIFGQPTTLRTELEELEIDILDVLDSLKPYETIDFEYEKYNEELDEYEIFYASSVNEYLDILDELGEIKELKADNSYNWSSPVSNVFNFTTYENNRTGNFLVEFKVHRFGDVRANYTDTVLLEFTNEYEFYEVMTENNKHLEVKGYFIDVDIFNDIFEVYDSLTNHIGHITDIDELDELIEDHHKIK